MYPISGQVGEKEIDTVQPNNQGVRLGGDVRVRRRCQGEETMSGEEDNVKVRRQCQSEEVMSGWVDDVRVSR